MFDIGFGEMIMLAVIALIAIGPKQLPAVARTVGRMLNEFKRATSDFSRQFLEVRDSAHNALSDNTHNALMTTQTEQQAPLQDDHSPVEGAAMDEHQQMSFDLNVETSPTGLEEQNATPPSISTATVAAVVPMPVPDAVGDSLERKES